MRCFSLVMCALMATQAHGYTEEYVRANAKGLWSAFKHDHKKEYVSLVEENRRYAIFTANMLKAARLEKKQTKGATFGISKFSDMTEDEFKAYHNLNVVRKPSPQAMFTDAEVKAAASSVDWRVKGAVTQVKDQGQCGSCWSFSTTGGIEGAWALAGNPLTAVSEQELVSCDTVDQGCGGGLMDNAFQWLIQNKGGDIVTEASYPYVSGSGYAPQCSLAGTVVGATIKSFQDLPQDEDQIKTYLSTHGPVSIAVDATAWQTYTGGILTQCCEYAGGLCSLDHGVLLVGYGADYWIVKNSWGSAWGESGYIRVGYGNSECGLDQSASVPLV